MTPALSTRNEDPRVLIRVGIAVVLAMAVWFSATAVLPQLTIAWNLSSGDAAWLTICVQLGFVAGCIISTTLNLSDRIEPRHLIAYCGLLAALSNLGLLLARGFPLALPFRIAVGMFLAGVYPPAIKLVSTHFVRHRGMAIGVMIGALTLGSGSPHLIRGLLDIQWQWLIVATSITAAASALIIWPARAGPGDIPSAPFDPRYAIRALRSRPLRLAILGYMGHMWELYAFWAWLPAFLLASSVASGHPTPAAHISLIAFAAIGVSGGLGAIVAGRWADRFGRTAITSAAMVASGTCCLLSGLVYGHALIWVAAIAVIWGAVVIADSAQFSAAATELADPQYVGSAVTVQTALGFAITIVSIRLVPVVAGQIGWQWALSILAAGPTLGTLAMLVLRRLPAATAMANGRR